jgi:S1-C subfamily serine protease
VSGALAWLVLLLGAGGQTASSTVAVAEEPPTAAAREEPEAVVQVVVAAQGTDPFVPWQSMRPAEVSGYGVHLGAGRILTTESLVRRARLVEIMAARSGKRIPADVLLADEQVNLALLQLRDGGRLPALRAAATADKVRSGDKLTLEQFDATRELQRSEASLLRVLMGPLPNSPHASLVFEILADQSVNGAGAPVFAGGKLAGLVMSHDPQRRVAALVPYPVVNRFLAEADQGAKYAGFSVAGFMWRPLVDAATRAWLKLPKDSEGGVLVLACLPGGGAAAALRPGDVLLSAAGHPLDALGFYDDPDFGRMQLTCLFKIRCRPGEPLPLEIVRDGARLQVEVTPTRPSEAAMLIPHNTTGAPQPYLIEGGLVLREASGDFIESQENWQTAGDPYLANLYASKRFFPDQPGDRVVLLTGVLPHPINTGYQDIRHAVVTHANGLPVSNMQDVFRIRKRDGHLRRFSLKFQGVDLVLDEKLIDQANRELCSLYGINELLREPGQGR